MPELIREPRKIGPGDPEEEPMWLRVLTGLLGLPTGGAGLDIATALATLPLMGITAPKWRHFPVKIFKGRHPRTIAGLGKVEVPWGRGEADPAFKIFIKKGMSPELEKAILLHELGHVISIREVPTLLRGHRGRMPSKEYVPRQMINELLATLYAGITTVGNPAGQAHYLKKMKVLSGGAKALDMTEKQFMKYAKERPLKLLHEAVDHSIAPTQIKREIWNIPFINLIKRLRKEERWVPGQERLGRL